MPTIFLDGAFSDAATAKVSALDSGLTHGVGLFETMLAVRDARDARGVRVIHLHEHVARLAGHALELGLAQALRRDALAEAVLRTALRELDAAPPGARARVRLTLTGGDLNMLQRSPEGTPAAPPPPEPRVLIVAQPATSYPRAMLERGVGVAIADLKLNPLNPFEGCKTLWYWPRLRELQRAGVRGFAEALVFQVTNHLAGGCVSSAVLVKGGRLILPIARGEEQPEEPMEIEGAPLPAPSQAPKAAPDGRPVLPSPVLPGITRRWVLDWADDELIEVERRMVTIADVLDADELLLTNSSWGVLPVTRVEGKPIGPSGTVGEFGRRLVAAWDELLAVPQP